MSRPAAPEAPRGGRVSARCKGLSRFDQRIPRIHQTRTISRPGLTRARQREFAVARTNDPIATRRRGQHRTAQARDAARGGHRRQIVDPHRRIGHDRRGNFVAGVVDPARYSGTRQIYPSPANRKSSAEVRDAAGQANVNEHRPDCSRLFPRLRSGAPRKPPVLGRAANIGGMWVGLVFEKKKKFRAILDLTAPSIRLGVCKPLSCIGCELSSLTASLGDPLVKTRSSFLLSGALAVAVCLAPAIKPARATMILLTPTGTVGNNFNSYVGTAASLPSDFTVSGSTTNYAGIFTDGVSGYTTANGLYAGTESPVTTDTGFAARVPVGTNLMLTWSVMNNTGEALNGLSLSYTEVQYQDATATPNTITLTSDDGTGGPTFDATNLTGNTVPNGTGISFNELQATGTTTVFPDSADRSTHGNL